MRIGLLSVSDPLDPRSWSGTPYFIGKALERRFGSIVPLGPLNSPLLRPTKALAVLARMSGLQSFSASHTPWMSWEYARLAERRIEENSVDAIVVVAASPALARLKTMKPIVYVSDVTFHLMLDYYPEFKNLSKVAARFGDEIEGRAIRRADVLAYPTRWASHSAEKDYGASADRLCIAPFGANLVTPPPFVEKVPGPICRMLFVGVNWHRKGAQTAIDTLDALKRLGVTASLTIVGTTPPEPLHRQDITTIPFLNKNDPGDALKMQELYLSHDVFILPTVNECFGIVFCEAAAHGMPVFTYATGGVPDVVTEAVTGRTLTLGSGGALFAEAIAALWSDQAAFTSMSKAARAAYEARLNWDAWAAKVGERLENLVVERMTDRSRR